MGIGERAKAVVRPLVPRCAQSFVRRVLGPSSMPVAPERVIEYPPDLADPAALHEMLRDTDLFGEATSEADGYLADCLERLRVTMALLPDSPPGTRLLELGANPYFMTRLLHARGLDVTCANWFGEDGGFESHDSQHVRGPASGWEHRFDFDHFNVESDRFPYDDESFDIVLCCEILEHLPVDPTHMLAEIHRVLRKPVGTLLLTTPNPVRTENLLRMVGGRNVYEVLSGYGVYGRHNREYTVAELRELLTASGFDVDEVFARDVHPAPGDLSRLRGIASLEDRGDNLFAIARASGRERWPYPSWLYSSVHAIRRVVCADVLVGVNEDLQTTGLHDGTGPNGDDRWMGGSPLRVLLAPAPGARILSIDGVASPAAVGADLRLTARWEDGSHSWSIVPDGSAFRVTVDVGERASPWEVVLDVDRTWRPIDVGIGTDRRTLGVAIRRIGIDG